MKKSIISLLSLPLAIFALAVFLFIPVSSVSAQLTATEVPSTTSSGGGGSTVSTSCYQFTVNMTIGARGADVVALQTYLIANGFDIPSVSAGFNAKGYFGVETANAVKKFQTSRGIPATGYVGPLTRAALNSCGSTISSGPQIDLVSTSIESSGSNIDFPYVFSEIKINVSALGGDVYIMATSSAVDVGLYRSGVRIDPGQNDSVIFIDNTSHVIDARGFYVIEEGETHNFTVGYTYAGPGSAIVPGQYMVKLESINWSGPSGDKNTYYGKDDWKTNYIYLNGTATTTTGSLLQLNAPTSGEVVPGGSSYVIKWSATPDLVAANPMVDIVLVGMTRQGCDPYGCGAVPSKNIFARAISEIFGVEDASAQAQTSEMVIQSNIYLSSGSLVWTVPADITNRIYSYNGTYKIFFNKAGTRQNVMPYTDNVFSISSIPTSTQASLTLLSPNGGETLVVGTDYEIKWNSNFSSTEDISIGIKRCSSCLEWIAFSAPNTGKYTWKVQAQMYPPVGQPGYKIHIMGGDNRGIAEDVSDGYFTISSTPTTNHAPVIHSLTAPTVLKVNEMGTWSVTASDPENGSLSYSINWGDGSSGGGAGSSPAIIQPASQTTTYTHTYANAGTYTVKVTVRDSAGLSAETTATVRVESGTVIDTVAPVISSIGQSDKTSTSIILTWATNEPATSQVEYGITSALGYVTPLSSTLKASHSVSLTGLTPGVTYFYRLVSKDASGNTARSSSYTFTTPTTNTVPVASLPHSITPSSVTANSGQWTQTMKFSVPSGVVATKLYMSCPAGLTVALGDNGRNICNTWETLSIAANTVSNMSFKVTNSTSGILKATPNFYIYKSDRPTYGIGITGEITVNPQVTPEIGLSFVSTATDNSYGPNSNDDIGTFIIKYRVTATNGNVYIPNNANAVTYVVDKAGVAVSSNTISASLVNNDDDTLSPAGNYVVEEGDSEQFTLFVTVPMGNGLTSGQYRLSLTGLKWDMSDNNSPAYTYTSNLESFKSMYQVLN